MRIKDERIKNILIALVIFIMCYITLFLAATCQSVRAQNVVKKGKTFVEVKSDTTKKESAKETDYLFVDKSDGKVYNVFVSKNGKAFIKKTSKKSERKYRRYLPEITKLLIENGTIKTQ